MNEQDILRAITVKETQSITVFHGTSKSAMPRVMGKIENIGKGFGGAGLYVDPKMVIAEEYAQHKVNWNNPKEMVIMEGNLNLKKCRVARITIAKRGTPGSLSEGIFPADWAKNKKLQELIHKNFNVLEVCHARDAGYAIASNDFFVLNKDIPKDAMRWKSIYKSKNGKFTDKQLLGLTRISRKAKATVPPKGTKALGKIFLPLLTYNMGKSTYERKEKNQDRSILGNLLAGVSTPIIDSINPLHYLEMVGDTNLEKTHKELAKELSHITIEELCKDREFFINTCIKGLDEGFEQGLIADPANYTKKLMSAYDNGEKWAVEKSRRNASIYKAFYTGLGWIDNLTTSTINFLGQLGDTLFDSLTVIGEQVLYEEPHENINKTNETSEKNSINIENEISSSKDFSLPHSHQEIKREIDSASKTAEKTIGNLEQTKKALQEGHVLKDPDTIIGKILNEVADIAYAAWINLKNHEYCESQKICDRYKAEVKKYMKLLGFNINLENLIQNHCSSYTDFRNHVLVKFSKLATKDVNNRIEFYKRFKSQIDGLKRVIDANESAVVSTDRKIIRELFRLEDLKSSLDKFNKKISQCDLPLTTFITLLTMKFPLLGIAEPFFKNVLQSNRPIKISKKINKSMSKLEQLQALARQFKSNIHSYQAQLNSLDVLLLTSPNSFAPKDFRKELSDSIERTEKQIANNDGILTELNRLETRKQNLENTKYKKLDKKEKAELADLQRSAPLRKTQKASIEAENKQLQQDLSDKKEALTIHNRTKNYHDWLYKARGGTGKEKTIDEKTQDALNEQFHDFVNNSMEIAKENTKEVCLYLNTFGDILSKIAQLNLLPEYLQRSFGAVGLISHTAAHCYELSEFFKQYFGKEGAFEAMMKNLKRNNTPLSSFLMRHRTSIASFVGGLVTFSVGFVVDLLNFVFPAKDPVLEGVKAINDKLSYLSKQLNCHTQAILEQLEHIQGILMEHQISLDNIEHHLLGIKAYCKNINYLLHHLEENPAIEKIITGQQNILWTNYERSFNQAHSKIPNKALYMNPKTSENEIIYALRKHEKIARLSCTRQISDSEWTSLSNTMKSLEKPFHFVNVLAKMSAHPFRESLQLNNFNLFYGSLRIFIETIKKALNLSDGVHLSEQALNELLRLTQSFYDMNDDMLAFYSYLSKNPNWVIKLTKKITNSYHSIAQDAIDITRHIQRSIKQEKSLTDQKQSPTRTLVGKILNNSSNILSVGFDKFILRNLFSSPLRDFIKGINEFGRYKESFNDAKMRWAWGFIWGLGLSALEIPAAIDRAKKRHKKKLLSYNLLQLTKNALLDLDIENIEKYAAYNHTGRINEKHEYILYLKDQKLQYKKLKNHHDFDTDLCFYITVLYHKINPPAHRSHTSLAQKFIHPLYRIGKNYFRREVTLSLFGQTYDLSGTRYNHSKGYGANKPLNATGLYKKDPRYPTIPLRTIKCFYGNNKSYNDSLSSFMKKYLIKVKIRLDNPEAEIRFRHPVHGYNLIKNSVLLYHTGDKPSPSSINNSVWPLFFPASFIEVLDEKLRQSLPYFSLIEKILPVKRTFSINPTGMKIHYEVLNFRRDKLYKIAFYTIYSNDQRTYNCFSAPKSRRGEEYYGATAINEYLMVLMYGSLGDKKPGMPGSDTLPILSCKEEGMTKKEALAITEYPFVGLYRLFFKQNKKIVFNSPTYTPDMHHKLKTLLEETNSINSLPEILQPLDKVHLEQTEMHSLNNEIEQYYRQNLHQENIANHISTIQKSYIAILAISKFVSNSHMDRLVKLCQQYLHISPVFLLSAKQLSLTQRLNHCVDQQKRNEKIDAKAFIQALKNTKSHDFLTMEAISRALETLKNYVESLIQHKKPTTHLKDISIPLRKKRKDNSIEKLPKLTCESRKKLSNSLFTLFNHVDSPRIVTTTRSTATISRSA